MKKYLLGLVTALTLTACASKPEGDLTGTIGSLYNDGMDQIAKEKYDTAVHTFSELQRQYPYSAWATKSEVMTAYAQMKAGNMEESIAAADHFIKMHPGHQDLPYVFYLKGLAYYNRMADVMRDQEPTQQALEAFEEVVNRFPDSPYARDAKLKITLCRDHLAGKEMHVGRFYQSQKQFLPAINRFQTVVKTYQTTSQTPEALYRLTESYLALGIDDEAKRSAAILGHNYPSSEWYTRAYELLTQKKLAPLGQKETWTQKIKSIF